MQKQLVTSIMAAVIGWYVIEMLKERREEKEAASIDPASTFSDDETNSEFLV